MTYTPPGSQKHWHIRMQCIKTCKKSPVSPMLCKKPARVGKVYMLVLTAVLTKKLWTGAIVLPYAFAAAVWRVHALSAAKF